MGAMKVQEIENMVGALALALSDSFMLATQEQAPELGPAAAALALLGHEPGMPIERLRRALGLSHSGTVRLIDRLVAGGLIERHSSEQDRRAVALHLTASGEEKCAAILAVRRQRISQALKVLDPDELESLGKIAEKLLKNQVHNLDEAYCVCRLCDPTVCVNCPVTVALEQCEAAQKS
jgi:MarR family transcriptional regulator, negative regulator of the multidrug operon emrRAB